MPLKAHSSPFRHRKAKNGRIQKFVCKATFNSPKWTQQSVSGASKRATIVIQTIANFASL